MKHINKLLIFFFIFNLTILSFLFCNSKNSTLYGNLKTSDLNFLNLPIVSIKYSDSNNINNKNSFLNFNFSKKFIYVLQSIDFQDLNKEDFDIAVVDCDDSKLTSRQIQLLHKQNKKILAYLSIGEAEDYRDYWQKDWKVGNPEFIDEENPCWCGNYKVKYWYKQWQDIIFSKLNQIISLGYDGAYLDLVDAYDYYKQRGFILAEYNMVKFVISLSINAKKINPDFLIIPQNAEELVRYKEYLAAIDGIGRESLWFENEKRIDYKTMSKIIDYLNIVKNDKKPVFVINYFDYLSKNKIIEFLILSKIHGFIPYIGPKDLNTIYNIEDLFMI